MKLKLMVIFLMLFLAGCATTAMYTSPTIVDTQKHIYSFSIETGGYAGEAEAKERATAEINKFMKENNYQRYKILYSSSLSYFSGFKYAVQFYK